MKKDVEKVIEKCCQHCKYYEMDKNRKPCLNCKFLWMMLYQERGFSIRNWKGRL